MNTTLTPEYWIYALLLTCLAVVFTVVLVGANGMLRPVQFGIRERYRRRHNAEIDEDPAAWWWKPLWGCPACVSGQWGFWFYLFRYPPLRWHEVAGAAHWYGRIAFTVTHYSAFEHLGFAAITIILSFIIRKWITE